MQKVTCATFFLGWYDDRGSHLSSWSGFGKIARVVVLTKKPNAMQLPPGTPGLLLPDEMSFADMVAEAKRHHGFVALMPEDLLTVSE